jgi:catechol 2,3-dioxygenase-like lactoylglutathione lyase family enzyme
LTILPPATALAVGLPAQRLSRSDFVHWHITSFYRDAPTCRVSEQSGLSKTSLSMRIYARPMPTTTPISLGENAGADMSIKFHHLHLKAHDPDVTAAWYERAFGFKVVEKSKRPTGDVFIMCRTPDDTMVFISGEKTGETLGRGNANTHLGLEHFAVASDDFDRDFAHLKSLCVPVLEEPRTTPAGIRFAFIRAPDDVRIELMYFPKG